MAMKMGKHCYCEKPLTHNVYETRVLTDRVARLLLDDVDPQNILCLTYTKAAASEMQNRLVARLGEWAMLAGSKLAQATPWGTDKMPPMGPATPCTTPNPALASVTPERNAPYATAPRQPESKAPFPQASGSAGISWRIPSSAIASVSGEDRVET